MGLSGRKVKQRIPNDPRNLSWADDAARFGSNYLSKFGWDASKGLGAGGDGMKSHIKVSHKLDMLGIGAGHTKDPNGIAWKQNKDFENLLRRLNENIAAEKAAAGEDDDGNESELSEDDETAQDEKKKKRKRKQTEEGSSEHIKKKKKEVKVEERSEHVESLVAKSVEVVEEVTVEVQKRPVIPRHRAHRARAIAAKNISSKSAAHISEILGVAPNPTSVVEEMAQVKLTSVMDTDALGVDKITTSTKSVADYFKDKLLARTPQVNDSATPSSSNSTMDEDEAYMAPRMGLGASRFQMQAHSEVKIEEATQRMGLSKFSSLMSSSFLASASSFSSFVIPEVENDESMGHISNVDSEPLKEKEKKKSKKRSKDVVEQEQGVEQKDDKKKKKKDKKGKNKEMSANEVANADKDTDGDERKKKSKKAKTVESIEESEDPKVEQGDIESRPPRKEKRTRKKEKVDEDGKKSRKDKKRHRTNEES